MKKIRLLSFLLFFIKVGYAQISFNTYRADEPDLKNTVLIYKKVTPVAPKSRIIADTLRKQLQREVDSLKDVYNQLRLQYLSDSGTSSDRDTIIARYNKLQDSVIKIRIKKMKAIEYWDKYYKNDDRRFFPAYYSGQAIQFFEGDTIQVNLFQNNLINYNPDTKKMILYTEAVNDYLGPLRVGIGFQVNSETKVDSLSTKDSTRKLLKKADLLSAIQNGGGNFSLNFKFPFIKCKDPDALIQSKFYLYANTGFSMPFLNKVTDQFIFNYDYGIEGVFYIKGFNKKITFFSQLKAAAFNGNSAYKNIIKDANKDDPSSFGLFQSSFGIDFMDGYRFRVDLYSGNQFVKNNFPASVTFMIRPSANKSK